MPNEDSNQPAHPYRLIRIFVVRLNKLCILADSKCTQWRFRSDCANAQADLNLRWVNMLEGTFSDIAAHLSDTKTQMSIGTFSDIAVCIYLTKNETIVKNKHLLSILNGLYFMRRVLYSLY